MKKVIDAIKETPYFFAGMICLLSANVPNIFGALTSGQTAPIGYLILIEFGLAFYLLDAIFAERPAMFVVSGVLNTGLGFIPLIVAIAQLF